ncbi:MAG: O-antigen ligase family protein [Eubacterium sp.]|nr:O-antigen ligase family protein [Eubacterium sp.]
MGKKNNNQVKLDILKKTDIPVFVVINAYLAYLCTFYLVYMHDLYFDITFTRAKCFMYGTISFIGLSGIVYFLIAYFRKTKGNYTIKDDHEFLFYKDFFTASKSMLKSPFFWAFMLLLSNFLSFLACGSKKTAFTGEEGRRLGLCMFILIVAMFFIVAYKAYVHVIIYIVFVAVSYFMFYIAIVQHFGVDFGKWRAEIKKSQQTVFMSTIGNMNTFGGYLCIFIAISIAVFIFTDKFLLKAYSGTAVMLGAFTVMAAKSDNVYLGLGVAVVLLFYITVHYKKLVEWSFSVMLMSIGFFAMSILNHVEKGNKGHLNGIAKIIGNMKIMGTFMAASVIFLSVVLLIRYLKADLYEKIQCRKMLIIVTVIGVLAVITVVILGISSKHEYFVFNDRWGEYRGFIWSRSVKAYGKGDGLVKVFGYGNESVRAVMKENYYEEMITIPKKIYDSCHNILLQQLLTTGIFGLITYLGFFISSMVCMVKNMKGNPEVAACAAACAAHVAQAMVNPEQPIVTPIFYVLLALGVGLVRKQRIDEINYKTTTKKRRNMV